RRRRRRHAGGAEVEIAISFFPTESGSAALLAFAALGVGLGVFQRLALPFGAGAKRLIRRLPGRQRVALDAARISWRPQRGEEFGFDDGPRHIERLIEVHLEGNGTARD